MTTIRGTTKKCAVCGHEQSFTEIMSTNRFGYMDLDTRPPEMERSTIRYAVQLCEECAYSSRDISKMIDGITSEDVEAEDYRAIADDTKTDKLAKAFLLAGHLYAAAEHRRSAGISYLNAAWVFDDLKEKDNAKQARARAIENIAAYTEGSEDIGLRTMLVDMHRRNGEFEEAERIARQLIAQGAEDLIAEVLELQIKLCAGKDDRCHTVEEV